MVPLIKGDSPDSSPPLEGGAGPLRRTGGGLRDAPSMMVNHPYGAWSLESVRTNNPRIRRPAACQKDSRPDESAD